MCTIEDGWDTGTETEWNTGKVIATIITFHYVKILTLPGKVGNSFIRIAFMLERGMRIEIGSHTNGKLLD